MILEHLYDRCQHEDLLLAQHDPSHKVVEVQLREVQFDSLLIFDLTLKDVSDLEHQEEVRWLDFALCVFGLCQLPISHHIPDHVCLTDGSLIQLFIIKVHDLIKSKVFLTIAKGVDAEPSHAARLDFSKGIVGLYFDENGVACGKVNRYRNLSFTHQAHDLITDRQVTNR